MLALCCKAVRTWAARGLCGLMRPCLPRHIAGDMQQYQTKATRLVTTVDRLRAAGAMAVWLRLHACSVRAPRLLPTECAGAQLSIELPTIAVCGNQSAGKSSLLEAICDVPLPRQSGTCTRQASPQRGGACHPFGCTLWCRAAGNAFMMVNMRGNFPTTLQ